ncbi:hypothetical protein B0H13DRAFT_2346409 [Mycena leptocephala]|nr:hypothetical protein B0H13DRAFT_2346409 [Mycena leptocephala]
MPMAAREHLIPSKAMRSLHQIITNDTLFVMIYNYLNCLALSYAFSTDDFIRSTEGGTEFWVIDAGKCWALWDSARLLSRFILAAAHGINVGLPMPNIVLAHSYPNNPLVHRRSPTREAALRACLLLQAWYETNLGWIAECLRRSITKGANSMWDFAAVLGMTKVDFYLRITEARTGAGVDDLDVLFTTVDDGAFNYTTALDLEVARLIRPWFTHIGVIENSAFAGMALYPVEYALASPMDRIMADGVTAMEVESEPVANLAIAAL